MPCNATTGLGQRVVDAGRRINNHLYEFIRLLRDFDDSGEWAFAGSRTCAHWLAEHLDICVSTARDWIRVARQLGKFAEIERCFAAGSLSYSKVRALLRIVQAETERALCELAVNTPARDLPCVLAGWLARHEQPEQTEARHQRATSLKWRLEPDGMMSVAMRLPPAAAGVFEASTDAHVMRSRKGRHESTTAMFGPPGCGWPSLAQQRAFSLLDLLACGSTRLVTELLIHVRADGCSLDDGTPIASSAVERIAPHSFLRALVVDAERRPVNASTRRRHPTVRQKRVVRARQPRCVDCGSAELVQFDHNPPYERTGRTHTDELQPRCTPCHDRRHADYARLG